MTQVEQKTTPIMSEVNPNVGFIKKESRDRSLKAFAWGYVREQGLEAGTLGIATDPKSGKRVVAYKLSGEDTWNIITSH